MLFKLLLQLVLSVVLVCALLLAASGAWSSRSDGGAAQARQARSTDARCASGS
jgi:hypothetical protein